MSRCYVGHLPARVTEKEVREVFEQVGPVTEVHLKNTIAGTRYAFLHFELERSAAAAVERFDGVACFGRDSHRLRVELPSAHSRPPPSAQSRPPPPPRRSYEERDRPDERSRLAPGGYSRPSLGRRSPPPRCRSPDSPHRYYRNGDYGTGGGSNYHRATRDEEWRGGSSYDRGSYDRGPGGAYGRSYDRGYERAGRFGRERDGGPPTWERRSESMRGRDGSPPRKGYYYAASESRQGGSSYYRGGSREFDRPRRRDPPAHGYRVSVHNLPATGSWQDLKDHFREASASGSHCTYADVRGHGEGILIYNDPETAENAAKMFHKSTFVSHLGEKSVISVYNEGAGGVPERRREPYPTREGSGTLRRRSERTYGRDAEGKREESIRDEEGGGEATQLGPDGGAHNSGSTLPTPMDAGPGSSTAPDKVVASFDATPPNQYEDDLRRVGAEDGDLDAAWAGGLLGAVGDD